MMGDDQEAANCREPAKKELSSARGRQRGLDARWEVTEGVMQCQLSAGVTGDGVEMLRRSPENSIDASRGWRNSLVMLVAP